MIYTCRCGAHHQQPAATIELLSADDHASFQLCALCAHEARSFLRNEITFPVEISTPEWSLPEDEYDDPSAELLDDDLRYELMKESA